jgi:hypothetical protein
VRLNEQWDLRPPSPEREIHLLAGEDIAESPSASNQGGKGATSGARNNDSSTMERQWWFEPQMERKESLAVQNEIYAEKCSDSLSTSCMLNLLVEGENV